MHATWKELRTLCPETQVQQASTLPQVFYDPGQLLNQSGPLFSHFIYFGAVYFEIEYWLLV